MTKFKNIYLLHGRGGSPKGSVKLLQNALEPIFPKGKFFRPNLPHSNYNIEKPEDSLKTLSDLNIPSGSLLIGVSLGGLVAAKFQEESRPDLTVVCIVTPTRFKTMCLSQKMQKRVVFYSSKDEVISDRVADWSKLAEAHDLLWLNHDIDPNISKLVKLVKEYLDEC
jgi:predicted esterase YcpF (UPF0227 family)